MDSAALDADWCEKLKDDVRFSLEWYREHQTTRELLESDVLYGNVIEFGCGIGARAYIAWLSSMAPDITGVDGSPFAIKQALNRGFGRTKLEFCCADLLALPYRENDFQNGYMLAVIEHIEDTDKLLSECKRVIAPGGKLFVSVTDRNYHYDEHHVHAYNARGLGRILGAVGKHIRVYVKDHIIYATVEVE